MKIVYVLLLASYLKCILLYKLYNSVPALELKRLARQKNKRAEALYQVANYGPTLNVLLWIIGTICGAVLLIWSARTNVWLAVGLVVFSAWLIIWAPAPSYRGWAGALCALTSKLFAKILSWLNPILSRVADFYPPGGRLQVHTGLYEKDDLLELLDKQNKQLDNRIDSTDLAIATGAMTFGDKKVREAMTPRRQIKFVDADETAGPMLMDELHKSGHSRFPVVKDSPKAASPDIVGTLYLKDIVGYEGSGKVLSLSRKDVYYINEDSSLRQALSAFLKTHHHILIAVNSFEEVVGLLSIEDVLEQIIGQPIVDEFDNYENLRAVAAKEAKAEQAEHKVIRPEPEPESEK